MGKEKSLDHEKKTHADEVKSKFSERDARLLAVICIELVNLCAKIAGGVDPGAAAMLAYVRDDIRFENKLGLP